MTHPFADSCPECGPVLRIPPVDPHAVQEMNGSNVRALYRCLTCGHTWFTGWNSEFVLSEQKSAGGAA